MSTPVLSYCGIAATLLLAACVTRQPRETVTVCEREPGAAAVAPQQPMAKAPAEPRRKAPLRYADANHDGKVTREEASVDRALAAAFDRYDKNGDGVLDPGEFAQFVADNDRRHPQPRQEFAAAEQAPAPNEKPAEEWRCHEVNGERMCPGARIRATATD